LAARFDGARDRGGAAQAWTPVPMKGLGAGDALPLPKLQARAAALTAPTSADGAPQAGATAGGPAYANGPAPAGAVRPEEEDFNYTYLHPARHKYELPTERAGDGGGWQYWASLGLRGAAALAVAYLILHSDLPFLVGLSRRRRDGTYGA
jgi:hypothetical protein